MIKSKYSPSNIGEISKALGGFCWWNWVMISMPNGNILIRVKSATDTRRADTCQTLAWFFHADLQLSIYESIFAIIDKNMTVNTGIGCQMLSWRTKNGPHFNNIWDTVTNVVPLYSVHQAPSYEPNLTLLAGFLRDLAYLSMLFILEVLCTASSAERLKDK